MAKLPSIKRKPTSKAQSLRERAASAAKTGLPKRRVRKAASAAGKPFKRVLELGQRQYNITKPRSNGLGAVLTKPRAGFPRYFYNSWLELRQVSWPNRRTTWKLVFAVFAFATVFGLAIALVDFVLELIFKRIIL